MTAAMRPFKRTISACYCGYIVQGIINNLNPLFFIIYQKQFGLSYGLISSLILLNFLTQIVVDLLCVKFVDKIGYRLPALAAHLFAGLGLLLLGLLPRMLEIPFLGLAIATMVSAIGGGIIEVIISPIIDSLPSGAKETRMSLLHSFYCWGQVGVVLLTTLLVNAIGESLWWVLPLFWAIVPLLNMLVFAKAPLTPALPQEEKIPLKGLMKLKIFRLALVLMICAGASELAMSQWSSLFAEKGLGISKVTGDLLGPCLFAMLMGIGRLLYGFFGERLNLFRVLAVSGSLCMLCYLGAALFSAVLFSLLCCALCGLSISLLWPGLFSITAAAYPKGGASMFGILALCGDIGCALGPAVTGLVSEAFSPMTDAAAFMGVSPDSLGLKAGMLAAVFFPGMLLAALWALKQSLRKNNSL